MSEVTSAAQPTPSGRGRMSTARLLMYLGILLLVLLVCLRLVPEIMLRQQLAALEAKGYPTTLEGFNHIHPPLTGPNRVDLYRQAFDLMIPPQMVLSGFVPGPFHRSQEQMAEEIVLERTEGGPSDDHPDGQVPKMDQFLNLPADIVRSESWVDGLVESLPEYDFFPFPLVRLNNKSNLTFDPPGLGRPWTEATVERVRRVVAANQPVIDLVLAARSIPDASWEVDPLTWHVDRLQVGRFGDISNHLQYYICLALIDGDIDVALDGLEAMRALSTSLHAGNFLNHRGVAWGIHRSILELAESMINLVALDEFAHQRLANVIRTPDWRVDFDLVIVADTLFYLQRLDSGSTEVIYANDWQHRLLRMAGIRTLQKAESVRQMLPIIQWSAMVPNQWDAISTVSPLDTGGRHWFHQEIMSPGSYRNPLRSALWREGQALTTLAALAIDRFWLAEGRLPDRLEELVPEYLDEVPISPFSGLPMKLVHFDGGCLVYFVDDQATDGGGFAIRNDGVVVKKRRHTGTLILRR